MSIFNGYGPVESSPWTVIYTIGFLALFLLLPDLVFAQGAANPIRQEPVYIGVNYPGLTVGYQGRSFNFELRGFAEEDIRIVGPRFIHKFYPFRGGNLYWALDAFYVDFEDVITEGNGYMGGPMIGLQKYLGSHLSLTADGGPYFVKVRDDLSGVESDGIQFSLNFGVNVHF